MKSSERGVQPAMEEEQVVTVEVDVKAEEPQETPDGGEEAGETPQQHEGGTPNGGQQQEVGETAEEGGGEEPSAQQDAAGEDSGTEEVVEPTAGSDPH